MEESKGMVPDFEGVRKEVLKLNRECMEQVRDMVEHSLEDFKSLNIAEDSKEGLFNELSQALEALNRAKDIDFDKMYSKQGEEDNPDFKKLLAIMLLTTARIKKATDILEETAPDHGEGLQIADKLEELRKLPRLPYVRVSKDIIEAQIKSRGDSLALAGSEKVRKEIEKANKKGLLLDGTLEGLSGGSAYLKTFCIAIAQTLNEQSKYFNTDGTLVGVPQSLMKEYTAGQFNTFQAPIQIGDEKKREFPYIIISYEDLAHKLKGDRKTFGGKEIEQVRDYIDKLKDKRYIIEAGSTYLGVPLIQKEFSIYHRDTFNEIGCIVKLSPQFSMGMKGYTGIRSDTLKLLGGGKQKDITMNLLELLLYYRNFKVWRRDKEELLKIIATGKRLQTRPKEREAQFAEAIKKVTQAKVLNPEDGYSEERLPGGRIDCIFKFNPNYMEGDQPEDQPEE